MESFFFLRYNRVIFLNIKFMINKKQITKTFLDLVAIDSLSGKEAKVATYIIRYLKKLKIKVNRDRYKNVIARLDGVGEPIILSAHMDTVGPGRGIKPVVKKNIIKSDGSTILGADDKAAIAEILEAVKYLKQKGLKHRPLELVFTREEESDFSGALNLDYKKLKAKDVLVLDYSLPPGAIVLKSPFIYIFDIKVKGRAAHAGDSPEKGINAIKVAGDAIADLKIGRINKSLVTNIAIVKGGTARNTVPDLLEIKGEVRAFNQETALRQVDIISKAFKKSVRKHKAKLTFKTKLDCHGYVHKRSNHLVKEIVLASKELRIKNVYLSQGVSDANVFNRKGMNAVVISKGGRNPHTTKENIKISEMQTVTKFLVEFLR